jgi:serine/threonine protein kinase
MLMDEQPLSAKDCAIGEVVAGKYLVEGVIGRGSMGVVVRATHLGFDELVALKFIRPEMRKLEGIVSRFAREAKASVRIRNEHAVNVLDVGVAEPFGPFFVMEYLEGINLEELVDSQGAFDSPTAVRYVLEACEALAAAHAQGIIHRDIKPQNMFLAWQGRLEVIKLLDFGISKAALRGQVFGDDLSTTEQDWMMGTPLYMSPEQLRHAPDVDERTDIWSLGAVLYELVCGQPLFSGNTQTEVSRQVLEIGTRPLRVAIPGVPDELWDVIERCLSRDRDQRFANVAELGEALLPFAPPAAYLHVERARALLGLKPVDFLSFDGDVDGIEEIEDIDVEPIDEPEEPMLLTVPSARARRPHWVELALPVLACAVVWIGYRQWELAQAGGGSSDDAIETVALALSQRPECPAPQPIVAPPAAAQSKEPDAAAPSESEASTAAPVVAPDMTSSARPRRASAEGPAPSSGAGQRPASARASSAPQRDVAPSAPSTSSSASPATPADAPSEARPGTVRRPQRPKPPAEPKLEFRLIDEPPNAGFDLVPDNVAGRTAPSAPAR